MRVTGIIAEYNPFHNGHLYQIEKTREKTQCDFIVVVMSGHFTQRGLPSISDKYTRTQMALQSGADLVLELPVPLATASAQRFSEGGISLLTKTGSVDYLSFGSECGDIQLLDLIARTLEKEPLEVSTAIQALLNRGISYPRARTDALSIFLKNNPYITTLKKFNLEEMLRSPNNILGIEYIKALLKYNSPIVPLTICRKMAHYHDTDICGTIASASAIRKQLLTENEDKIEQAMPDDAYKLLMDTLDTLPSPDDLSPLLQHKLIMSNLEDLYTLWDIPNNLCRSVMNTYGQLYSFSEIASHITSKTYSKATVQRALLRILLSIDSSFMAELEKKDWIPYIRVLGCKKEALSLLSHISKTADVPLITNLGKNYNQLDSLSQALLNYEERATALYYCMKKQPHKYKEDFKRSFIII